MAERVSEKLGEKARAGDSLPVHADSTRAVLEADLVRAVKTLTGYVEGRCRAEETCVEEERKIRIDAKQVGKAIPLDVMHYSSLNAKFLAVDCSTLPLLRANNWGVYLLRVAYALLKPPTREDVDWDYLDRIITVVGSARQRALELRAERMELESGLALNMLNRLKEGDYVLLDGVSSFGRKLYFRVELYNECKRRNLRLLTISKRSPSLVDRRGRDFIALLLLTISYPVWAAHVMGTDKHRYGNVYVTKLSPDAPIAFRCDVMDYLSSENPADILSPLTPLAQDPRCEGYPVALYLAHDFTRMRSYAKRLEYRTVVEDRLRAAGILDSLLAEESIASFRDRLLGVKYPFEWEEAVEVV